MAKLGSRRFGDFLFGFGLSGEDAFVVTENQLLIVGATDSAAVSEATPEVSQPVTDALIISESYALEVMIDQTDLIALVDGVFELILEASDSVVLSEDGRSPLQDKSGEDLFTETEDFLLIVGATDSVVLTETPDGVLAQIEAADSIALIDSLASISQSAADSAAVSESAPTIIVPVTDSGAMSDYGRSGRSGSAFSIWSPTYARVITVTALGGASGIAIRTQPILSSVPSPTGAHLLVPINELFLTKGGVTVPAGGFNTRILFDLQDHNGSFTPLATQAIYEMGPTNLGLQARIDAGLATGGQTLKTITGNFRDMFGIAYQNLLIRMSVNCIDREGNFITIEPDAFPVASDGSVSVDLWSTEDLYVQSGDEILYEILLDALGYPLLGGVGFTVPAGAGPFTFGVTDGAVVVT